MPVFDHESASTEDMLSTLCSTTVVNESTSTSKVLSKIMGRKKQMPAVLKYSIVMSARQL